MIETPKPPTCYNGCQYPVEYAFVGEDGKVFRTCRVHHPSSTYFLKPIPLKDADVYEVMNV